MTELLESSFYVRAKLKTTLKRAEESLKGLFLAPRSDGTRLSFTVTQEKDERALLILDKAAITYRFYFKQPEATAYSRNLSMFIALLSLLKDDYSVECSDLFPQMMESLRWSLPVSVQANKKGVSETLESLTINNYRLAHDAIESWRKIEKLERSLSIYKELSGELVEKLCGLKVNSSNADVCASKLKQIGVRVASAETLRDLGD